MLNKTRQQRYRTAMLEKGYKQYAFWLSDNAQAALKLLAGPDGNLSAVVDAAIQHYHAYILANSVTTNVASDTLPVADTVTRDSPKLVTRYMPQDLESYILDLRRSGLSLNQVSERLFNEGHRNAKGLPYSTGTLSKAEARAKARSNKH